MLRRWLESFNHSAGIPIYMRVVAVVAMPGSGKSEAAAVAREMGIPVVTMGDVIRQACRDRDLEVDEETMGRVATELREEGGDAAIAERSIPIIEEEADDCETVLVDGIRGIAEVERFQEAFGQDFELISIEVPFEVRLERIRDRGRDPTAESAEDLRQRDERELGYGMGEAMKEADITVENTGTLEEFRARMRNLLSAEQVTEHR